MPYTDIPRSFSTTLYEFDARMDYVMQQTIIDGVVTGTNTLTFTSTPLMTKMRTLKSGVTLMFVVANTNTSATTVNVNAIGAYPIYKDTPSGPIALTGGELYIGNSALLTYDAALNTNRGGFHLVTAPASAGTFSNATFSGLTIFPGAISITAAGILYAPSVSASGNITNAGIIYAASVSATGSITAASINTTSITASNALITRISSTSITATSVTATSINATGGINGVSVTATSITAPAFTTSGSISDQGRVPNLSYLGTAAYVSHRTLVPSYQYSVPTDKSSVIAAAIGPFHSIIMEPAASIPTVFIAIPAVPAHDGQIFVLTTTQSMGSVAIQGASTVQTIGSLAANVPTKLQYVSQAAKYFTI